jgi:DNA-directed RNA polymerase subunit K/omega
VKITKEAEKRALELLYNEKAPISNDRSKLILKAIKEVPLTKE